LFFLSSRETPWLFRNLLGLGVPVGFGMTNSIIFHECATQIYVRSGWSKISKSLKDERFEVEIVDKKIGW